MKTSERPMTPLGERIAARLDEMGRSQAWLGRRVAEIEGRPQPYGQRAVSKWLRDARPKALYEVALALGLDYEELRRLALRPGGFGEEPAPYEAEPPLTVGVFMREGMTALEAGLRAEGLPFDAREAALTVMDWWLDLTEERGLPGVQRIMDAKTAADLRAALIREAAREVRSTARARRILSGTDSG